MTKEKLLEWEVNFDNVNVVECYNKDSLLLGTLELLKVGRHTHWCWCQEPNIQMSGGCVEEMRIKQKSLFKDRRLIK